jgi:hypothetical protein
VVEAEAAAAADQALALGDGYVLARAAALDLAEERAGIWQRAAERQLEQATTKLLDSLDAAAALHVDWLAARQQVLLAASAEMRRRTSPKLAVTRITAPIPRDPTVASLLAVTRATTRTSAPRPRGPPSSEHRTDPSVSVSDWSERPPRVVRSSRLRLRATTPLSQRLPKTRQKRAPRRDTAVPVRHRALPAPSSTAKTRGLM